MNEDSPAYDPGCEAQSARRLELQSLLAELIEGKITDAGMGRLEELLDADPAARAQYYEQVQIHSMLLYGQIPPPADSSLPQNAQQFAQYVAQASNQAAWLHALSSKSGDAPLAAGSAMPSAASDSSQLSPQAQQTILPSADQAPRAGAPSSGFGPALMSLFQPPIVFLTLIVAIACAVLATHQFTHPGNFSWQFPEDPPALLARAQRPAYSRQITMTGALLTSAVGCNWQGADAQFHVVGSEVQIGDEINLHEGIAEFCLASGAMLSVEGPATLLLLSPNSVALEQGRLTVYVPAAASDFCLITPASRITASEVEFGVNVRGGIVDTHVFSGDILVQPMPASIWDLPIASDEPIVQEADLAPGAMFANGAVVKENRGLELIELGNCIQVSRWHAADQRGFNAKLAMSGQLSIDESYVAAVRASQPLGYWRFEEQHADQVANEIENGMPLKVVGTLRLAGQESNRVADFGPPGSRGLLLGNDPIEFDSQDDYTVEVWLKPNYVQQAAPVCLLSDLADRKSHAFMLQLFGDTRLPKRHPGYLTTKHEGYLLIKQNPGSIRVLHRDPDSQDRSKVVSRISQDKYAIRRWQHFVVVKAGNDLRLYVDAVMIDSEMAPVEFDGPMHLLVGQQAPMERHNPFFGQLDELAVYKRALTEKEIAAHFRAVKWKQRGSSQQLSEL